jgi:hypothetical protein
LPKIFISYRREDAPGYAGRLFDRLRDEFGRDNVFIDVDTLRPGDDFVEAIRDRLAGCDPMLVVIGPRWASAVDGQERRRLDDENDYVRLEVQTALERGVRTIPVLVERAAMPQPLDLPEPIRPLSRRHAIELSDTRWEYDIQTLVDTINVQRTLPHGAVVPSSAPASHGASQRPLDVPVDEPVVPRPAVGPVTHESIPTRDRPARPRRPSKARTLWPLWLGLGIALALTALLVFQWSGGSSSPPRDSSPSTAMPTALLTARQIIDRHVAAVGGRAAILAHTSSHSSGTVITSRGMSAAFEGFAAKPNKMLERFSFPVGDIVLEGFDGQHGWTVSPVTGPVVFRGKRQEERKFLADFYSDLHAEGADDSMTTLEKTPFEGRPCYKVQLVGPAGIEEFEFYDVETGLKRGSTGTRETTLFGTQPITIVYTDYRQFGDLLRPATITKRILGAEEVTRIKTIVYDQVDPAVFQPPAEIKALLK